MNFMGLGHNDPWVESHIRPQQMWGQRSSRGQWPLVGHLQNWSLYPHTLIYSHGTWTQWSLGRVTHVTSTDVGQRSSRGQWPLVQVFAKTLHPHTLMYFQVRLVVWEPPCLCLLFVLPSVDEESQSDILIVLICYQQEIAHSFEMIKSTTTWYLLIWKLASDVTCDSYIHYQQEIAHSFEMIKSTTTWYVLICKTCFWCLMW